MRASLVAVVSVLALVGCRSGPEETGSMSMFEADFRATGEVALSGRIPLVESGPSGARFNQERVVGAQMDMSRRGDGSWGGWIYGQAITVNAEGNHIFGSNANIHITQSEQELVIGGTWANRAVRIVVNDKEIRVTHPRRSFTLPRVGVGLYGEDHQLRFIGEAEQMPAPQPQLALALLGTI